MGAKERYKKFTGQRQDDESGLYYYHSRYYDTVAARFTALDPAAFYSPLQFLSDPQQLNLYSYVRNNPVGYTDPTGENPFAIAGAAVAGFIGVLLYEEMPIAYAPATPEETLSAPIYGPSIADEMAQDTQQYLAQKGYENAGKAVSIAAVTVRTASEVKSGRGLVKSLKEWRSWKGMSSEQNLQEHFGRHGKKMGFQNIDDYNAEANRILNAQQDVIRLRERTDTVHFDIRSGNAVIIDQQGEIRSFQTIDRPHKLQGIFKRIINKVLDN